MRHVTDTNYRKGSLCPNKKKVVKQKNVNILTAEIGIRQKILEQEAMRPHLGNVPTGNISAIGEAGTHVQYREREIYQNFKTRFLSGCSKLVHNRK